ncbi:MAG: hypothetical protein IKN73_00805 [Alphaproteobacteria bacterium]|nr:hypothetical protein [Alphaproteobacteria bacterium]
MKVLKKIWLFIVGLFPLSAGAIGPVAIGALGGGAALLGVSIWRSVAPVDTSEAFSFFSSCWTCQIFSDIMIAMSDLLPGAYHSLGLITIPMSIVLLAILMAWRIASGFINNKVEESSKITGNFGNYIVKLTLLMGLLLMPLPRVITNLLIEPIVTLGTSFDYMISSDSTFSECMLATAMADPVSIDERAAGYGAFSPKLRHQLACEVANVHQITGLGMTVGWTMLNMAFNREYMHKILSKVHGFPNVPLAFAGFAILVLYFFALLPIPLFFLEIFINLSMDLIMLPLMLMAWMFDKDNFAIFPQGGKTIRQMIDDVIKGTVGIGLTVVFLTFSVLFLNAAFGGWQGATDLQKVIENGDSKILLDGLMMHNDSIITVVLMGIFIAMFLTMIPQLTNMLFKIKISDKYYETAKKDANLMWENLKKLGTAIKK